MDPIILESARRHGVSDQRMLDAYHNPIRVFENEDLVILVGSDEAARLLEVGVTVAEGIEFIVHAMPARPNRVHCSRYASKA